MLAYFRHEVWSYVVAAWHSLRTRSITTVDQRIAWLLLLTAIPGAIIGALFTSVIEDNLGDPILIGVNMILFALVLQWADGLSGHRPTVEFHRRDAVADGRRAGARPRARRVAIGGHDLDGTVAEVRPGVGGQDLVPDEHPDHRRRRALQGRRDVPRRRDPRRASERAFFWGIVASMVSGFIAIAFLLRFVRTHSFTPFVIYRIVLGVVVIVIFATGIR